MPELIYPSELSATPPSSALAGAIDPSELSAAPPPSASSQLAIPDAAARMRQAAIPHELRGYTPQELAAPGTFINPRTGQRSTVGQDLARVPVFDSPVTGSQAVTEGAEQMAQPSEADKLRGAGKVFTGAVDLASPALAGLGVTAPLDAAAWYAISKGLGTGAQGTAKALGANEQDAQEIGDVASAAPLLAGAGDVLQGKFADAIDAHNARAAKLVEQDAAQGRGVDLGQQIAGEEIPLQGTQGWKVTPNGASVKGRPNYAVVDENGRTLYAGNGQDVQQWLASNGVERTFAKPAEEPAAVSRQAEAIAPGELSATRPAAEAIEPSELSPAPPQGKEPVKVRPVQNPGPPAGLTGEDASVADIENAREARAGQALDYARANPGIEPKDIQRRFALGYGSASRIIQQAQTERTAQASAPQAQPQTETQPTQTLTKPTEPAAAPAAQASGSPTAQAEEQSLFPAEETTPTAAPKGVVDLLVSKINADPARFQFKANTGGASGTGEELKSVQTFDPNLAGVIAVWYDPADGKTYVVNGHHRLELAQRTGQETITARYLDVPDASQARQTGALINIAEGRGTPIDAAKVFREGGLQPQDLAQRGVSLTGTVARQGMALAKLAPSIFDRVVQGDLPVERAAILGESLPDHQEQQQALALLDKAEARGKRPTNAEVKELIDLVKGAPKEDVESQQTNLFGAEEITKNAALEKAGVSDYIRKRLGQEKRLFLATGDQRAAEQLGAAGNVIKREENARIASEAAQALAVYDKLKASAGEVHDEIDKAARRLIKGRHAPTVKSEAYERVREALSRALGTNPRRSTGAPESGAGLSGLAEENEAAGQADAHTSALEGITPDIAEARHLAPEGAEGRPKNAISDTLGGAAYSPNAPLSHKIAEARAGLNEQPGYPPALFVNRQAFSVLHHAVGEAFGLRVDRPGAADAVTMNPAAVREARKSLLAWLRDPRHEAATRQIEHLLSQVDRATADENGRVGARGLILVNARADMSAAEVQDLIDEERAHHLTLAINGSFDDLLDRDKLVANPTAHIASATLTGRGYPQKHIAAEIVARLIMPDKWQELGLKSRAQAAELAVLCTRLLKEHNGDAANEVIGAIAQNYPEAKSPLTYGDSGRTGRRSNSIDSTSAIRPGKPGPDLANGSAAERQDSLFGASENNEVAESASRDRDQLEGERLTAQLRSPVTRDEQLKKLKRSKENPQTNFFEQSEKPPQGSLFNQFWKDETGTLDLAPVQKHLRELMHGKDGEPKRDYSAVGALKSLTIRNLSQMEEASPASHAALVRAAAWKAQAAALLRAAWPKVVAALGKGTSSDEFRAGLIESRLQGTAQRWRDLARLTRELPEKELRSWIESGPLQILDAMSADAPLFGEEDDLAQRAAALIDRGALLEARDFVAQTFENAAGRVHHLMTPEQFQELTKRPGFQKALDVYHSEIEPELAENHKLNEGVFSDALGPLDTYYPLTPVRPEDQERAVMGARRGFKKPANLANQFATGLSSGYDTSMEAFAERAGAALRVNDKAAAIQALASAGILHELKPGERGGTVTFQGKEYAAKIVSIGPARSIVANGKVAHVPEKRAAIPEPFYHEVKPILEPDAKLPPNLIQRLLHAVAQVTLSGPADAIFHSHNLLGALIANTPFLGKDLLSKTIGNTPFTKAFTAIVKVATVDPMDSTAVDDLQQMAKLGLLPERFGSVTFSKNYAALTGAKRKIPGLSFSPVLYGPKGIDVRARLVMYRLAKEINPNASTLELYKFVNQLGNYTEALQGHLERRIKSTGLSPFYTAGSTMIRNGIDAWLGTGEGSGPGGGWKNRLAQMLSAGALGVIAAWILTYKLMTGKWPWEDQRAKLLKIPASHAMRHSRLGVALWGPDTNKVGYINFGFASPMVSRGARAIGVQGATDTALEGGNAAQMAQAAKRDIANTAMHPLAGPPVRVGLMAATGKEAYLVSDREGGSKLMSALPKKAPIGSEALYAAKELNSFYGNVGAAAGFGSSNGQGGSFLDQAVRAVVNMTGLLGGASNPYTARQALQRERAAHASQQ